MIKQTPFSSIIELEIKFKIITVVIILILLLYHHSFMILFHFLHHHQQSQYHVLHQQASLVMGTVFKFLSPFFLLLYQCLRPLGSIHKHPSPRFLPETWIHLPNNPFIIRFHIQQTKWIISVTSSSLFMSLISS